MCIIFLDTAPVHNLSLILAFNRDEAKSRPTLPLHYWESDKLYAGKDNSTEGLVDGTWLGISENGNFGALLNDVHCEKAGPAFNPDSYSRGRLVPDLLTTRQSPEEYISMLQKNKKQYNFFNLVMGQFVEDQVKVSVYNYYHNELIILPYGISCYGNLPPSYVNPRTEFGSSLFSRVIAEFEKQNFQDDTSRNLYITDVLLKMLSNTHKIPNNLGLPESFEHVFNEGFNTVRLLEIGTVSSTILLVDKNKNCLLTERTNFVDKENCVKEFKWNFRD